MKYKGLVFGIVTTLPLVGCSSGSSNDIDFTDQEYVDGTFCAEIDYYYSETGTNSTYTLEVEVEGGELTAIHWPNGGWLDDSHFTPPDISDGEASFTSDMGADYTVRLIGSGGDCNTDSYVTDEDEIISDREEERERQEEEEQEKQAEEERIQQEEEARERQEEEERVRQEEEEERRRQEKSEEEY